MKKFIRHYARARIFYHFLIYLVFALIVIFAVGFNLPLAYLLGIYIPIGLLGVLPITNLIRNINAILRVKAFNKKIEEDEKNAVNNCGVCGTGKTFEIVYEKAKKAEYQNFELQYDYWENCLGVDSSKLSGQELEDFNTINDSYNFVKNTNSIPLLFSNIPIKRVSDGKFSNILVRDHLEQKERLPFRAVAIVDEINTVINNEEIRSKAPLEASELFRWSRQFLLLSLSSTEQNMMRVNKELRNVIEENREFFRSKNILKPFFLTWIYKRLRALFVRKMSVSQARRFSPMMRKLKTFLNLCGYKKLKYKLWGNSGNNSPASAEKDGVSVLEKGKVVLYIPFGFDYVYDTRGARPLYQAKDKEFVVRVWDKLTMSKEIYDSLRSNVRTNLTQKKSKDD